MNFHLREAGSQRRVNNFSGDIKACATLRLMGVGYLVTVNDIGGCDWRALDIDELGGMAKLEWKVFGDSPNRIFIFLFGQPIAIFYAFHTVDLIAASAWTTRLSDLYPITCVPVALEQDSEAYVVLLKQIAPKELGIDDSALQIKEGLKRAEAMLQSAEKVRASRNESADGPLSVA
jgi:hypothetical protein